MPTLDDYLNLIAPEHRNRPDFVATVALEVQPFVDMQVVLDTLLLKFDIDYAVGQQLDTVGLWVGRSRFFNDGTTTVTLDDYSYRILLKAKIAANQWDGTLPGAYAVWNSLLNVFGFGVLIQDFNNMSIAFALIGQEPDPIIYALFVGGALDLKPEGVRLYNVTPSVYPAGEVGGVVGTPYLGFDVENENIAGFDVGAWAIFTSSE